MQKIKYSDKLDGINFRTFESYDFKIKSESLEVLIEKICKNKKYKKKKDSIPYIQIKVESLNDDTWILLKDIFPSKELSMLDAKRLASSIATHRILGLSPDLSEIYFEKIHVKVDETTSALLYFDYSLIYGDYKLLDLSKPIRVNVPWKVYEADTSYYIIQKLINNPNDTLNIDELIRDGVYYMYGGTLYDNEDEVVGYIEDVENPIPLSLIYKYMDK